MSNTALVTAQDLSWRSPEGGFVLHVPRLELRKGERRALVGPSGSGKSTFLGLLSMGLKPSSGRLIVAGHEVWTAGVTDMKRSCIRASYIGFVPQTFALLNFLTVRENIALPLRVLCRQDEGEIGAIASRLEIFALLDRHPESLSVGQRQRVAIARALVHQPAILLADEPTASLHPAQSGEVMALLAKSADNSTAVLIATHEPDIATRAGFTLDDVRLNGETTTIGAHKVQALLDAAV